MFDFLFLWLCIKESNYLLFKRGLRLLKGLCLLFFPNVPGAMLIQGGTFIPDSRVRTFIDQDLQKTKRGYGMKSSIITKVDWLDYLG